MASTAPSASVKPMTFQILDKIDGQFCNEEVLVRLLHFWEARNFKKGNVLMGVEVLLLDSQSWGTLKLSIMGNEKAVSGNTIVPLHGRPFTRAFASKLITSSEVSAATRQINQTRANTKRRALDEEKKPNAPKKRAVVLKDITNVTCETSCFNAAKVQENSSKVASSSEGVSLRFVDIDSDDKDHLLCSLYAPEIYDNLRVAELKRRPFPDFMETTQRDVTQNMRGILVDWLVEVSEEYKLVPDTLYLTVYLIDWFLHGNYMDRQRLQLLGITCMLIASKYEEIYAPQIEELCFITDNTYTRDQVLEMESQVLKHFSFQIYTPTSKTFLRRFIRAAQASYLKPSLEMEFLANYLTELTLIDYQFLKFLPSVIAASAVFLAKWTLNQSSHPWNPTLEHYTTYKASDLKASVQALQGLQLNTKGCSLNSIRMKYRQDKFKSVAIYTSPKLPDKLF